MGKCRGYSRPGWLFRSWISSVMFRVLWLLAAFWLPVVAEFVQGLLLGIFWLIFLLLDLVDRFLDGEFGFG